MHRAYSGKGDDGFTNLLGHERVPKYDPRPEAYGTVDEAQAAMGLARAAAQSRRTQEILRDAQRDLYHIMAQLATTPETTARVNGLPQGRTGPKQAKPQDETGSHAHRHAPFNGSFCPKHHGTGNDADRASLALETASDNLSAPLQEGGISILPKRRGTDRMGV